MKRPDAFNANRLFLCVALAGALLVSAESRAGEPPDGKQDTSATADFARGDAASDPVLLPRRHVQAPDLRGVEEWINSAALTLAGLRGKVVVLHFFTFGCINCIHNQPAYKDWYERFSRQGAVVLGIHTPEGTGDRKLENIRKAIQDQAIAYPVAVDNNKENWNAWRNRTWPSVYLIDKEGYVRYWWYGELNWQGAHGEKICREKIAELLAEGDEVIRGATPQKGA